MDKVAVIISPTMTDILVSDVFENTETGHNGSELYRFKSLSLVALAGMWLTEMEEEIVVKVPELGVFHFILQEYRPSSYPAIYELYYVSKGGRVDHTQD